MTVEEGPRLAPGELVRFPDPHQATAEGVIAVGGNLSPGMLLSAYCQGCFPWFNEGEPVVWWNPDPRMVLFPDQLKVSTRMQRTLRSDKFSYSIDRSFELVMRRCGSCGDRSEWGTWISERFIGAYLELHRLGYAHSVEVYYEGELAGGLYGVQIGSVFCGESMFSDVRDSSKAALHYLTTLCRPNRIDLIDCQMETGHLASLGAAPVPRSRYMNILGEGIDYHGLEPVDWSTS